jgi:hypothetical protein
MWRRLFEDKPSVLDEPIANILSQMNEYGSDSPEYPKMLKYLSKLIELKAKERKRKINPDTMLMVAGNLLGILVIVAYEQKNAMVSKGLGFVIRPK